METAHTLINRGMDKENTFSIYNEVPLFHKNGKEDTFR